jgi:predicted DsbA family dithiol-disulfide isomerase
LTWIGPREAGVTLYEFFDFNCPWCRAAARDLTALIGESGRRGVEGAGPVDAARLAEQPAVEREGRRRSGPALATSSSTSTARGAGPRRATSPR